MSDKKPVCFGNKNPSDGGCMICDWLDKCPPCAEYELHKLRDLCRRQRDWIGEHGFYRTCVDRSVGPVSLCHECAHEEGTEHHPECTRAKLMKEASEVLK